MMGAEIEDNNARMRAKSTKAGTMIPASELGAGDYIEVDGFPVPVFARTLEPPPGKVLVKVRRPLTFDGLVPVEFEADELVNRIWAWPKGG